MFGSINFNEFVNCCKLKWATRPAEMNRKGTRFTENLFEKQKSDRYLQDKSSRPNQCDSREDKDEPSRH